MNHTPEKQYLVKFKWRVEEPTTVSAPNEKEAARRFYQRHPEPPQSTINDYEIKDLFAGKTITASFSFPELLLPSIPGSSVKQLVEQSYQTGFREGLQHALEIIEIVVPSHAFARAALEAELKPYEHFTNQELDAQLEARGLVRVKSRDVPNG